MKIRVNGKSYELEERQAAMSLQDYLREDLDLTGTKNACNMGVCGGCTVLLDEKVSMACHLRVADAIGKEVLTIEGMARPDGTLHPLQQAFVDHGAIQCGYCTPGMVLTAHAFLLENPEPTRADIRHALRANLCRCTGYQQIVDAVEAASIHYRKRAGATAPAASSGAKGRRR
jgi:carbon-monoxide dehydrogenase small subunit